MKDTKITYKEIKKILSNGIHKVTFTKKDGTERVIKATLDKIYLAKLDGYDPKVKSTKPVNENVVCCIDTDIVAWRSFRVDSVKTIER